MGLGLLSAGNGALALVGGCFLIGDVMSKKFKFGPSTVLVFLSAMAKFPLLVLGWRIAQRSGTASEQAFIGGLLLVYSVLVGWAAHRNASDL